LFVLPPQAYSQNRETSPVEISRFDLRFYNPINFGLKDLVFEARISNLLESLNKRKSFGILVDVYFKIYWIYPGKYKIEVFGFPEGFVQVKNELSQIMKARLDYIIPQKLGDKLRSYSLSTKKTKRGSKIKATDKTNMKNVSEMQFVFNNKGMLTSVKTYSPAGVNKASFKMGVKQWSHNKWVLNNVTTVGHRGTQKIEIENEINYTTIKGIGFPSSIKSKTTYEYVLPKGKENKAEKSTVESEIKFSKFEVNTKKASRKILKNKS